VNISRWERVLPQISYHGLNALLQVMPGDILLGYLTHRWHVEHNGVQMRPAQRGPDAMGARAATHIQEQAVSGEVQDLRPRQGWPDTPAMHDAGEGACQFGLLHMRLEHLSAASIDLRRIGEYRLFHALKGPDGVIRDHHVEHPPEVGRDAVEEIVFREGGQRVTTFADLHQTQGRTHRQQRAGRTAGYPQRPKITSCNGW
jgi:hypothetical protein